METATYKPRKIGLVPRLPFPNMPDGLWIRGSQQALEMPMIAVVGARACSAYGRGIARQIGTELAQEGYCVISGLARGIDTEAHWGAVEAEGRTVAVLGCGIDRIYPHVNEALAERVLETGGAIVSEYEPGVPPAPWQFPARNRIIAGLAIATIVVEAREQSGALITADFAMEAGRPVYAVPGEITSTLAIGTNRLIAQGAYIYLGNTAEMIGQISRILEKEVEEHQI